ncbi:MAG: galactokinase [Pseudomonadota bacterium]
MTNVNSVDALSGELPRELLQSSLADFEHWADCRATHLSLAPGRVNLMGDHTDYADGLTLPMGVDLFTVIVGAVDNVSEQRVRLSSEHATETSLDLESLRPMGDWSDYVSGVLAGLQERGFAIPPMTIRVGGNLPLGSGLSSSASLEMGMALLIEQVCGRELDPYERVLLCQSAEQDYAGVPCGFMDQHAVGFAESGKALILDCAAHQSRTISVPSSLRIAVIDSGVRHAHSEGGYGERRMQVERATQITGAPLGKCSLSDLDQIDDPLIRRRARHVVTDSERVETLAQALSTDDSTLISQIMTESHRSLKEDFEISCPEIDELVDLCGSCGALGARMTGGGFGGSVVALVAETDVESFSAELGRQLPQQNERAVLRWVLPADGARTIALQDISDQPT